MTPTPTFPETFLWGAATASYQIEGAAAQDGRTPSIWDVFSHRPGAVLGGDTGDVACDHYHRFAADVALMADLGLQAYRFSISWSRVLPHGVGEINQAGLDFYNRLVDELLARGIRPVVTLYHWDLPQVLDERGGWLNREVADWFAEYAAVVVDALGDRVTHWITLNEPWCSSILAYALGEHAPGHHDGAEALTAAHHLLLAHGRAVPIIRAQCPSAEVSIALNLMPVWGPNDQEVRSSADAEALRRWDNITNGIFLEPLFSGTYPEGFLLDTAYLTDHAFIHEGDLAVISAPLDAVGINYYTPLRAQATTDPDAVNPLPGCVGAEQAAPREPVTAMGWEVAPEGFREIVRRVARTAGVPIYITENGSAWEDNVAPDGAVHDPLRIDYLRRHLAALHAAMTIDGVDVRGYFAWSLLDNFEWAFGYSKRFGLVRVDYGTQQRTIKDSGRAYAKIIAGQARSGPDLQTEVTG
ncbi:MAG: GH1 family beta-glucosidase [Nostocoides sp.]